MYHIIFALRRSLFRPRPKIPMHTISFGIIFIFYLLSSLKLLLWMFVLLSLSSSVFLFCFVGLTFYSFDLVINIWLHSKSYSGDKQAQCNLIWLLFTRNIFRASDGKSVFFLSLISSLTKIIKVDITNSIYWLTIFFCKKQIQFWKKCCIRTREKRKWTLQTIDFRCTNEAANAYICNKPFDHGSTGWQTSNKKSS